MTSTFTKRSSLRIAESPFTDWAIDWSQCLCSRGKSFSDALEQLRTRVTGSVVRPGDNGYDKQRTPWLQVVEQHPSAIVNAHSVQDIVEAIRAARELDLPLGVQNTGHGIAVPCNEGILLRLSEMKDIAVDPAAETATVGPGVSSGELLNSAEPHRLAYRPDRCPTLA